MVSIVFEHVVQARVLSGQDAIAVSTAFGCLPDGSSNNVAEYIGLLAALGHARTLGAGRCCFQVDSLLVAGQVRGQWACRSSALIPLLEAALRVIRLLEASGTVVLTEHIYREYNKMADQLANQALDTQGSREWTVLV